MNIVCKTIKEKIPHVHSVPASFQQPYLWTFFLYHHISVFIQTMPISSSIFTKTAAASLILLILLHSEVLFGFSMPHFHLLPCHTPYPLICNTPVVIIDPHSSFVNFTSNPSSAIPPSHVLLSPQLQWHCSLLHPLHSHWSPVVSPLLTYSSHSPAQQFLGPQADNTLPPTCHAPPSLVVPSFSFAFPQHLPIIYPPTCLPSFWTPLHNFQ